MIRSIIVESVDRMGKDTLISGLRHSLGPLTVLHFGKPELLDIYNSDLTINPLKAYQEETFKQLLLQLSTFKIIANRSHIGEAVYAKRYRGYDGNYVFDLEEKYDAAGFTFAKNTLLVTLMTSDFSFIQDDGKSFDFSKKEEEQADMLEACRKSIIKRKLVIDVNDGGKYLDKSKILKTVLDAYNN